jgi:hypothetical protein
MLISLLVAVTLAQTDTVTDRFTFTAADGSKSGPGAQGRLELAVTRWSSDAERDRVRSVVTEDGPDKVLDALRDAYAAGWIHWPGNLDYTLRYARRTPRPDGGEDVVLVIDSRTWIGWHPAHSAGWTDAPFSVLQLRLDKAGTGEGKLALGNKIRGDKEAGIVLDDYAGQPTFLNDVRRERPSAEGRPLKG